MEMYRKYIVVEGDSYSRGLKIGEELKVQIELNYQNQEKFYLDKEGFNYGKWGEMATRYLPYIEKYAPEVLEELEGMAKGAGMDFKNILALTTAYEKSFARDMVKGKCTSFQVTGEATYAHKTIVGQTNEECFTEWLYPLDVVIHHIDGEHESLIYTHPGVPAYSGINNHGLAVLWEYIDNGVVGSGVPTNVIIRHLLNLKTADEAIEFLQSIPHDIPNEFGIADKNGRIVSTECFPNKVYIDEGDGYLVHTNHIVIAKEEPEYTCSTATWDQYEVMEEQIKKNYGNIDVDMCKDFLKSHERFPNCICAHLCAERPWNKTFAAMVYDLSGGEMHIAFDNPCEAEYKKLRFRRYFV